MRIKNIETTKRKKFDEKIYCNSLISKIISKEFIDKKVTKNNKINSCTRKIINLITFTYSF